MIHLNLIDAAERLVESETVAPVHVTNVKDLQNKSRKKVLTVLVAALFVFAAFSCFLSVAGVPKQLHGLLPTPYLDLVPKTRLVRLLRSVLDKRPPPVVRSKRKPLQLVQ